MAEPGDRSQLKDGVRLLREVLKATRRKRTTTKTPFCAKP